MSKVLIKSALASTAMQAALASKGLAIADETEQGDKNKEISDSSKMDALMDMIKDACSRMDEGVRRSDARMDAMEENFRRMDARMDASSKDSDEEKKEEAKADEDEKEEKEEAKADASKKDEDKGEPEEPAADRKDSEKEEKEEGGRADEDDDKAKADSAPISRADFIAMQNEIKRLQAQAPALLTAADRERFGAIQEQADSAFQAFGDRAPAPLDGETPTAYKRRLGSKLQAHSTRWGDVRLSGVSDEVMLDRVLEEIYADSIQAARKGVAVPSGQLRERVHQRGGHTIIEFEGESSSWMNGYAGHAQRATGNWNTTH